MIWAETLSAFTFQSSQFKNMRISPSLRQLPMARNEYSSSRSERSSYKTRKSVARRSRGSKSVSSPTTHGARNNKSKPKPKPSPPSVISIDEKLNRERLRDNFDCQHFGKGAGCVTEDNVRDIKVIRSSKLYFGSSYMQKHLMTNKQDDFYKVIVPSELTQWRTQAKLAVAPKSKWGRDGCVFGLYERKSHKVMPILNCEVHHPSINRAVEVLKSATAKVKTVAFDVEGKGGGLRYIQCQVDRVTGKISLSLVWDAENLKECQPGLSHLVKEIKRLDPSLWYNIWCHTNDSLGNAIFARGDHRWHLMSGPEYVREQIPGTDPDKKEGLLHFVPMVFRQGNMDGFEAIALHVAKAIPGGSKVCELYAGVGLLGLTALTYHSKEVNTDDWWEENSFEKREPLKWIRLSDENPANHKCFNRAVNSMPNEITGRKARGNKYNKQTNGKMKVGKTSEGELTLRELMEEMMNEANNQSTPNDSNEEKVIYKSLSASKAIREGEALGANVLIVDPPRKGLDEDILFQLSKPHNPKQTYAEDPMLMIESDDSINWVNDIDTLIYVSCGFDSCVSDCDRLLKGKSGWKVASATGYVLFPGSNHVETVLVLKRQIEQRYRS